MQILVVGSGIMGNGIAQTFAQAGHTVTLNDLTPAILETASANIKRQLTILENNGLIDAQAVTRALSNLSYNADLSTCTGSVDLVIEAIPERFALKEQLFKQLDEQCPAETIFATNTSGIAINKLAGTVRRKDKFIGMHFFMPAHLIPLVEVVCGDETSIETSETVMSALRAAGKKPVKIAVDIPGFIANRLQHALAREAMSLVAKGVASPEAVDEVVKSSLAIRLLFTGPIEQRDFNGLDTHLSIAEYLYQELENTTEPLAILRDKVAAGELGLKTGQGFYDWREQERDVVLAAKNQGLIDVLRFLHNRNVTEVDG